MPINKLTTDYTGREKDLHISQNIDPRKASAQKVTYGFGRVSSYCAGVQKLIQRYAITLLTIEGSQKYASSFGTEFLKRLRSNNLSTVEDLTHIFNFANYDVIVLMRNYQAKHPDLPADEQLDTAVLDSIDIDGTNVKFNVKLYTLAGDSVDFLLPVPIN